MSFSRPYPQTILPQARFKDLCVGCQISEWQKGNDYYFVLPIVCALKHKYRQNVGHDSSWVMDSTLKRTRIWDVLLVFMEGSLLWRKMPHVEELNRWIQPITVEGCEILMGNQWVAIGQNKGGGSTRMDFAVFILFLPKSYPHMSFYSPDFILLSLIVAEANSLYKQNFLRFFLSVSRIRWNTCLSIIFFSEKDLLPKRERPHSKACLLILKREL